VVVRAIRGVGAVVEERGGSPQIQPILVDPPGRGEVLIGVQASGVCHSDHWAIHNGNWGEPFPMLLGHEGAGVVQEVGEAVEDLVAGDPVLLTWAMPCGRCPACRRGAQRKCAHAWTQPPRMRLARTGERIRGALSLGTLATHTVINAGQAVRLPAGLDPERACLLGCGASTGVGAALNTAAVWPGSTVAVIGLGGIGLSALQGARLAGAGRAIGVDVVRGKLEWARDMGASDVVDASAVDAVAAVREITGDAGVDVAFEATGVPNVVAEAMGMLSRGGVAVAIGVPPPDSELRFRWGGSGGAYSNKTSLLVTDGGDPVRADFATWLDWARDRRIDLDAMVSSEGRLTDDDVAEAIRAMLEGRVIRTVIRVTEA
jgi:S-(hydroxymethyl)mycothiol dehydrogenase